MSADQPVPQDFGVTFRSAGGRTVRCRADQFVLDAGYVLLCCSTPLSDLLIE